MRKLILFCFLILSFSSSAQRIIVGLNGGVLYNTAPEGTTVSGVKRYGSLKIGTEVKSVMLNVGADIGSLSAGTNIEYIDSASSKVQFVHYTYEFARNFVMPNISVNVKFPLPKSNAYFGGNAGYIIGKAVYMEQVSPFIITKRTEPTSGASVGAQAGYTFEATEKFGINVEAAARYTSVGKLKASIFYFPLSFGLRYKF
jgi:hypothetical protein